MSNTDIRLLTVNDCCESGRFSRATFYRLVKNEPKFPALIKIGGSTRVRGDEWTAYIDALGKRDEIDAVIDRAKHARDEVA